MAQSVLQEIVEITSCPPPWSYTEYRFETPPDDFGRNNATMEMILWLSTPYVLLETEQYLYPFKSLVADVEGTLGLFHGILTHVSLRVHRYAYYASPQEYQVV